LIEKFKGRSIAVEVLDPLGRKISAGFGLIDEDRTAVIEMAAASGLRLLPPEEFDPLHATSLGTGELIKAALDQGASNIVVAIGGSATVDGGAGVLQALGVRFLDATGNDLPGMPASLLDLHAVDLSGLDPRLSQCATTVLCDVENPLLGEQGAAQVFGPQKGATPEAVGKLEIALTKLSDIFCSQTGKEMASTKRGGAAGGVAAGLHTCLNAKLVNGIEYFLDATDFDAALSKADLVVTGEGSIDEQTLQGKGPFGVALRAQAKNIPVIGLAGTVPLQPNPSLQRYFDVLLPIGAGPVDAETALRHTAADLERTAMELGNLLALNKTVTSRTIRK
jgi:glycerate kinase